MTDMNYILRYLSHSHTAPNVTIHFSQAKDSNKVLSQALHCLHTTSVLEQSATRLHQQRSWHVPQQMAQYQACCVPGDWLPYNRISEVCRHTGTVYKNVLFVTENTYATVLSLSSIPLSTFRRVQKLS